MGDISEMRGVIVLLVFVTATVITVSLIPSEIFISNLENRPNPDIGDISDIIAWNATYQLNILDGNTHEFSLGGYNYKVDCDVFGYGDHVWMFTYAEFLFIEWDIDTFRWYYGDSDISSPLGNNYALYIPDLDVYENPVELNAINGKTKAAVTVSFNASLYSNFSDAYDNDGVYLEFNSNWEDRATSLNALQVVNLILVGGLPNLHPALSVILALIGWAVVATTAYLIFIFALRLVGAIFGGGGA